MNNLPNIVIFQSLFALSVLILPAAVAADFDATKPDTSRTGTSSLTRINGVNAGLRTSGTDSSRTSSTVRTHDSVRQSRQAHGHARMNHVINHLSGAGGRATNMGSTRSLRFSLGSKSQMQTIVMTSGHDKDEAGHADSKTLVHAESKESGKNSRKDSEGKRGQHDRKHDERKASKHHEHHRRNSNDGGDGGGGGGNVGSGNQGIGDGSNVSYTASTDVDELNNTKIITLHEGTAFVAHNNKPVVVKTTHGEVRIAPKTAVYIVSSGRSVAVHNIADRKDGDVSIVTHGNKEISIKSGEQLMMCDSEKHEYDKENPVPEIKTTRMKALDGDKQTSIFHAEFSPLEALDHSTGFQDLVNSTNKEDQALANHILKTAAVMMTLRASDSP